MNKKTKIWLSIAACFILIGCFIFSGVMTILNWDFTKLSTVKYVTNNYEMDVDFKNISVISGTAHIVFLPAEGSKAKVVCREQKNAEHTVAAKDSTLRISLNDHRKWYEHIGINFESPYITVYLPQGEYGEISVISSTGKVEIPEEFSFEIIDICESTGDVTSLASATGAIKITTDTGDINVRNISAGSLELSVSTGKVTLEDITSSGEIHIKVSTGKTKMSNISCKSLRSKGSTGSISLAGVISEEEFDIERSTGNVIFESCDASKIFVKTDTGNVKGTLLSDKVFITNTDTGRINVPKTLTGGKCEISTSTGDIKIEIK